MREKPHIIKTERRGSQISNKKVKNICSIFKTKFWQYARTIDKIGIKKKNIFMVKPVLALAMHGSIKVKTGH